MEHVLQSHQANLFIQIVGIYVPPVIALSLAWKSGFRFCISRRTDVVVLLILIAGLLLVHSLSLSVERLPGVQWVLPLLSALTLVSFVPPSRGQRYLVVLCITMSIMMPAHALALLDTHRFSCNESASQRRANRRVLDFAAIVFSSVKRLEVERVVPEGFLSWSHVGDYGSSSLISIPVKVPRRCWQAAITGLSPLETVQYGIGISGGPLSVALEGVVPREIPHQRE